MDSARLPVPADTTQLRLPALDGYELGAALYTPFRASAPQRVALLHCGAGIPCARYRGFAGFLAEAGIPVLTYDYRGIGHSRPRSLRGFRCSFEDWAEYDCGGAIAWLRGRYPQAAIVGIAHSIGALLFGGARNSPEQAKLVIVGGHTAYCGDYHPRYRLLMTSLWHGLMPAVTRALGYFPARRLGLGEDIPAQVAMRWAQRRSPELRPAATEPYYERFQLLLDRCAALQRPALVVNASDDAFATARGTKRLLAYYPRLFPIEQMHVTPADANARRIGHFGYFSRKVGAALWPRLLARL